MILMNLTVARQVYKPWLYSFSSGPWLSIPLTKTPSDGPIAIQEPPRATALPFRPRQFRDDQARKKQMEKGLMQYDAVIEFAQPHDER